MNELIRDNLQLLIYHKQYAGTELILDLKTDLPSASADEYQFGQVLLNLFINALQAMDQENGRLHISTNHVKDSIIISIEDNGKGIAPENINKIFEPFFTTKAPGQGTGLGLSIVYTIIKAHNGDIRVSSSLGKGTIFTIYIPVYQDCSQLISDAQFVQSFSAARTDIKKVMLIEDHETVRKATSDMLRQYFGFDLVEAENGKRAIEALMTNHDYDLIVSDIRMTECDGFWFYDWLRSNRIELCDKIIFYTGDFCDANTRQMIDDYNIDVISKPFSVKDFENTIKKKFANIKS